MEGSTELSRPQEPQAPKQEGIKPEDQSLEAAEAGWLRRLKVTFNRVFFKRTKTRRTFAQHFYRYLLFRAFISGGLARFKGKTREIRYLYSRSSWLDEKISIAP